MLVLPQLWFLCFLAIVNLVDVLFSVHFLSGLLGRGFIKSHTARSAVFCCTASVLRFGQLQQGM